MPEKKRRGLRTSNFAICAVLAGSLVSSGCFFKEKKQVKVFTPPPVVARVPPEPVPVELEPIPEQTPTVESGSVPEVAVTLPPAPPKPPPAKPQARPQAPVVVETPPPATGPKPTIVYGAEERRQLNQELDNRLASVRRVLARTEGKSLSSELNALANSARSLLIQAEQARPQDLVTAVDLAKRADLLAMDLATRLP